MAPGFQHYIAVCHLLLTPPVPGLPAGFLSCILVTSFAPGACLAPRRPSLYTIRVLCGADAALVSFYLSIYASVPRLAGFSLITLIT